MIFKVIKDHDLKVLKESSMVQSMHVVTIKFDWVFVILKRKKKRKEKHPTNTTITRKYHTCGLLG